MKQLMLNGIFIAEHIDELVTLEDYVPLVSFIQYDKHHERENFLKSKKLLTTIHEMDQLIQEKCRYYEDPAKAWNSVIIEWLDCHPEFEQMISDSSYTEYQNIKGDSEGLSFLDLLYFKIPSEKKSRKYNSVTEGFSFKDDSNIKLPDFGKMEEMYDKYPSTILADYLAYIV